MKKKGSSRRGAAWRGSRDRMSPALLALIALIGVAAAAGGLLLQRAQGADVAAQLPMDLQINELMSDNAGALITETGDMPDWIELRNAGGETVSLKGYLLMLSSEINKTFCFPDGKLAPGECALVYASGAAGAAHGDWSAGFRLPASGGMELALLSPQNQLIDRVDLPELAADQSYARGADGSWALCDSATPGADNDSSGGAMSAGASSASGELELSEVMSDNTLYCPDADGACYDYVEIHNRSGARVQLGGWYLSDSMDKLKRWSFPERELAPDGYLLVYCSGLDRADADAPHTDFKLSAKGEDVYLSRPDGEIVSSVALPALEANQAWSLSEGEWSATLAPTPGRENSREAAARALSQRFASDPSGVQISEIMAAPSDEPSDWIELYNASGAAVDLSGCGLSDDASRPRRWQFPAGTMIQAGEYMGVMLTGDADVTAENYICADFALSTEGGYTVSLSDPDGKLLDAAFVGEQYGGVSFARFPGEEGFFYAETPTPLAANSGAHYRGRAPMAQASKNGGLFKSGESFTVELSAPAGSRIYYTLDCTDPDEGDALYTGPIQISSTTILRSRVYRDGEMPSYIAAQSYLYDVEVPEGVYVISLVSDPDNLYSESRGILVKGPNAWSEFPYGSINRGANFWMDWERAANVELFTASGELGFAQPCGIKLHGQFSRAGSVKAFKVFARSEYGKNRFEYPIFKKRNYDSYQSFLLRASGQDYNMTFMRDAMLTRLAEGTSLMYQESELGVCYLNGEYYSLFNLRERVSRFSVCQFEGWEGMEDDIDLIKANNVEKEGSNASMEELLDWLKHNDPSTQEAYEYIDSHIDIQNYIEYMAIEIFSGNSDTLNVKRYRNAKVDGKWRWVLFDLDWAFLTDTNSMRRWINPEGMGTNGGTDNSLFIACLKNPTFRDRFLTHFGRQMATNFTTEHLISMFDAQLERLKPLLPDYLPKVSMTAERYKAQYEKLTDYAKERPQKMLKYLDTVFHFTDEEWQHYFGEAIAIIRGE